MKSKKIVINNPNGLDLDLAGIVCKKAVQYKSLITFAYRDGVTHTGKYTDRHSNTNTYRDANTNTNAVSHTYTYTNHCTVSDERTHQWSVTDTQV